MTKEFVAKLALPFPSAGRRSDTLLKEPMSHNSFGHLFRITTWGESHGPAIGCVVDGCPPGIPITEAEIQAYLDKRKPGQSRYTTQRQEPDQVRILSGVFTDEERHAGHHRHADRARDREYRRAVQGLRRDQGQVPPRPRRLHLSDEIRLARLARLRPRDRARETAKRVAAGAIARKVVPGLSVRGALTQIGPYEIDRRNWDWDEVGNNPFFCPDAKTARVWADFLDQVRKKGSSAGAIIEIVAEGVPPGLGAPLYGKLDQDIASGLMSINAVKGVEIGAGFASAALSGEENADEMRMRKDGTPEFLSNNAGGILGGISTGQPIVARFAVKPTSSILTPRRTVDASGHDTEISTKGRHDPCVGIRAVPIGEAMVAIVLADHYLRHRGQTGRG